MQRLPTMLQFIITPAEEGGFVAEAIHYAIHTEGETLDETVVNIKEAVRCHFEDESITTPFSPPILVNFEASAIL